MTCPDCEYHKQRAALWRHEAYRLGGTPLPWDADEAIAKAVAAEREKIARQWDALHEQYMADPLRRQMMLSYEMVARMIRGRT